MTGLAAVVARELQEWKRVYVAALFAGFLVFLTPLLPTTKGHPPLQVMNTTAGFLAGAFGLGVALIAGGGLIGRDLTERRMTFYFFRPLRAESIWGGKLLAAFFLAFFSALLAMVPATLVGGGLLELEFREALAVLALGILVLVILGNTLNLIFRARSKWVLLDLAAFGAVAGLLGIALLPFVESLAFGLVGIVGGASIVVLLMAMLVGGLVGLTRGRIDLREVHKFQTFTMWPVMGVLVIVVIAYSMWVRAAGPHDLLWPTIAAATPNGGWLAVTGRGAGRIDYQSVLLMNLDTRDFVRIEGGEIAANSIGFSTDGRRAAWFEPVGLPRGPQRILDPSAARLVVATLGRKPAIQKTTILVKENSAGPILSGDGTRIAIHSDGLLTITDLDTERTLASVRIPDSEQQHLNRHRRMRFLTPDLIRIFALSTANTLKIYEFDIGHRQLEQTGTVAMADGFGYRISPRNDSLLVWVWRQEEISLHDARTGRQIATVPSAGDRPNRMFGYLSGGRIALVAVKNGHGRLDLFSESLEHQKTIDLGLAANATLGGEIAAGKLVVSTSRKRAPEVPDFVQTVTVFTVDLDSGEMVKVADGLIPLVHLWWWNIPQMPAPGSPLAKIFRSDERTLEYFDPLTGERRAIAGHKIRFTRG